jgi:hypothetical protein
MLVDGDAVKEDGGGEWEVFEGIGIWVGAIQEAAREGHALLKDGITGVNLCTDSNDSRCFGSVSGWGVYAARGGRIDHS